MRSQLRIVEETVNPLDRIEDILTANNWAFNRMNDDELIVDICGKNCDYRMFFLWQEDMSAMQFCCQYDMDIDKSNHNAAAQILMSVNENLWMGHFDIPKDTGIPSYRHTCLFRGVNNPVGIDYIEDLVDICLAQCERYYPVFYLLSNDVDPNDQNLALAVMETLGES